MKSTVQIMETRVHNTISITQIIAIQVYFVYDLRRSESERVRSGCGRKDEPEVVEPRAAEIPQTY
jgi:hypothetical protein